MNNQQEKTPLTSDEKRELKRQAHHLKPVIQLGKKRVSESLIIEINSALLTHGLIKIQVASDQKATLDGDLSLILQQTAAEHIDTIGNIIILYKKEQEQEEE